MRCELSRRVGLLNDEAAVKSQDDKRCMRRASRKVPPSQRRPNKSVLSVDERSDIEDFLEGKSMEIPFSRRSEICLETCKEPVCGRVKSIIPKKCSYHIILDVYWKTRKIVQSRWEWYRHLFVVI